MLSTEDESVIVLALDSVTSFPMHCHPLSPTWICGSAQLHYFFLGVMETSVGFVMETKWASLFRDTPPSLRAQAPAAEVLKLGGEGGEV